MLTTVLAQPCFDSPLPSFPPCRPSFSESSSLAHAQDVGKSSNDLLSRDYPLSGTGLEFKTRAPSGVAFTARGNKDPNNNVNGDFEGRWSDAKKGLTVTQVRFLIPSSSLS